MRVGFDARWYNNSGAGVYVEELLRAIVAAPQRDFDLVVYEDPLNPVPLVESRRIERIAARSAKYSLAGQFEFRRRAELDRLDVFHSPFYAAPLSLHCPIVVTVHDLIPFLFSIYNRPKQALIKMMYRAAIRRTRHIIANSANTAADLVRILAAPREAITTIPLAAAREYSPFAHSACEIHSLRARYKLESPYVVLSSARNWQTKNLQSALQTLQIAARQRGTKFQTVVYGPPDGIEAMGPPERWTEVDLRCLGYVPRLDLAALFRHAQAFLMPSLYEGFGLPVLEAMACGCPVVTSNAGSLPEVAGDGAQVFAPLDCAGMAEAIGTLLEDPAARSHWRDRALKQAARFSWEKTAIETITVYRKAARALGQRHEGVE